LTKFSVRQADVSARGANDDTVLCGVYCVSSVCREYHMSPSPTQHSSRHFYGVGSKHCRRHCAGNRWSLSDFRFSHLPR